MKDALLKDIKVLDVGSWVAGPAAATILGDLGADVIKIEPPGIGDPYRYINYVPDAPQAPKDNYAWQLTSRNKRSLAIDIKSEQGYKILCQLIETADVFVSNFPPKVLEKLKLRYEDIQHLNECLVYGHLSGYGENGDEINTPAFDRSAFWARSGMMDALRIDGSAPRHSLLAMGDHPAALATYGAIMTGLFQRERTGKGGKVSTSLMATGAWCNALPLQAELCGAKQIRERPRSQSTNALALPYGCKDDQWFLLWIFDPDGGCTQLLNVLGQSDLLDDSRFSTLEARTSNAPAFAQQLEQIFAAKNWSEWEKTFDANDIAYVQASTVPQVVDDPQFIANDVFVDLVGTSTDATRTVNSPIFIDGYERQAAGPAPEIGEHSESILKQLGLDSSTIQKLRDQKVIS